MRYRMTVLSVAGVLLIATGVSAETVTATLTGVSPWAGAQITVNGTAASPTWESVGVGQLQWGSADWRDANNNAESWRATTFWTYCIQAGPTNSIYLNQAQQFTVVDAIQSVQDVAGAASPGAVAGKLSVLFGAAKETLLPAAAGNLGLLTNTYKVALQLAIWEVIYDGVPSGPSTVASSFRAGNFRVRDLSPTGESGDIWNLPNDTTSSAIFTAALALLNNTTADPVALQGLRDDASPRQNQAIVAGSFGGQPPSAVPVPAAAMAGVMLLALNAIRSRIHRRV